MSDASFRRFLNTPQPAELGPGRRAETMTEAALNNELNELLRQSRLSAVNRRLVRALLLLWHDHLDDAHTISQAIENADGSFVHAIMHRREPDYWNSKYWFRRVGPHPCFSVIAKQVKAFLESKNKSELLNKLLPDSHWNAFAFVDACEDTARGGSTERRDLLREIQRIEFEVLLDWFLTNHASA